MITQNFLNFLRDFALNWIAGLPALPPEWSSALTSINTASSSVSTTIQHLGILLPMTELRFVIGFLPAMFGLYLVTQAIRIVTKPFTK